MRRSMIRSLGLFVAMIATSLLLATVAQAGPPLICHTIEIGQAKSLPWNGHNWNLSGGESYDTKNLVRDTLEILVPDTPILVRMETLRRATLYARKDPVAAKELLARLHARATSAESSGHPEALAWFDVGYLAETYKQWIGQNLPHITDGMRMDANPAAGVDGYAFVKKAVALPSAHHSLWPPSGTPRIRAEGHRRRQNRFASSAKPGHSLPGPPNRNHVSTAG